MAFLEKPISKERLEETFGEIRELHRPRARSACSWSRTTRHSGNAVIELIGGGDDVEVTAVGSARRRSRRSSSQRYDCMVLDLKLPEMGGFALLEKRQGRRPRYSSIPVIVYTGKELTRREETKLKKFAETIIVKDASSPERLLDETSLFLHRVEAKLPQEKRRMLEQLHSADEVFKQQEDPDRRRRRAERLRAHERPRVARHGGAVRRERQTTASSLLQRHPDDRPRPDGHHDAGDGRLRDDAGDPLRATELQTAADHLA